MASSPDLCQVWGGGVFPTINTNMFERCTMRNIIQLKELRGLFYISICTILFSQSEHKWSTGGYSVLLGTGSNQKGTCSHIVTGYTLYVHYLSLDSFNLSYFNYHWIKTIQAIHVHSKPKWLVWFLTPFQVQTFSPNTADDHVFPYFLLNRKWLMDKT